MYIYKTTKFSRDYNQKLSGKENQNCLNDCIVFKGLDITNETLGYVLQFKGEAKSTGNKNFECILHLLAHKGSGFENYVVLNNLPQREQLLIYSKMVFLLFEQKYLMVKKMKTRKFFNWFILDVVYCIVKIL